MGVREGLLVLLEDGPRHGYGLKSAFEHATGGVWPLNVGQVYSTLDRLERDGLVAPTPSGDDQRAWELTNRGRQELGEWWWAVPGEEPPPRDELVLKVLLAIAGDRDHAFDVIGHHRDALLGLLAQRKRQARSRHSVSATPSAADLATELTVDILVMRAEADLRWLDICEARLSNARPPGATDEPLTHRPKKRGKTK